MSDVPPPIPAATVVLVRDAGALEVLMLRRNSKIAFGGMWVFPGGRIDPEDYPADRDPDAAARNAAVREALEETGIALAGDDFVWFAHWTPPPTAPKRFATWFFMARATDQAVQVDGGEIEDHAWMRPQDALALQAAGEIDLAPPTWITLHQLSLYPTTRAILDRLTADAVKVYATRIGKNADGAPVAMWYGDAGYESGDSNVPGARHRLVMPAGAFTFENTVETY